MLEMIRKEVQKYKALSVQVRASFWFLVSAFLQKGIMAITTPIFTRLMNTTQYGQFDIFNSWLGILTGCITLNLSGGMYTSGLVKFEDDRKAFASSMEGLTLTLVFLWGIIYFAFRAFWNDLFSLTTAQMVLMLLIIWGTAVFIFWSVDERVDFKYRKLVAVTLVMSLAKPGLGILFVQLAEDKVTARIIAWALAEVLIGSVLFWEQMRRGKTFFSAKYWKHALATNIPLIPHYLSTTVLSSADRIMIGRMIDEASAGIYGLAYSISMVMTVFHSALLQTIEPWLYRKINEKRIEDIAKVAYPAFVLIAAVNLLLIALAPEAVAIFAPSEYYDAIWVIPPVAMSNFFTFSYVFFAAFEFYFERTKSIATATCAGAVLNIILNYIFIKLFGYCAAGYTTLFCYMVFAAFHYLFMRKICREYLDGRQAYSAKKYLVITGLFLMAGFAFLLTYSHPVIRYAMLAVLLLLGILLRKQITDKIQRILRVKRE